MTNPLEQLYEAGQSIWLDYISRELLTSGKLSRMVEAEWITGVTSNPTIFRRAIDHSPGYDAQLRDAAARSLSPYDAFLSLAGDDVRQAADILLPVFEQTQGADGFVSFEAQAGTPEAMIAEAQRMFALVGRRNVMIKVPAIPEAPPVVEELIASGINVNVTLLFDADVYEGFTDAYIAGLERRLALGEPVDNVASVASFFISRVDIKVDKLLPPGSPLRGRVAVANARRAYGRFLRKLSGGRWQRLAASGARVQRPLWASTGTKNPSYSDVFYVEELVAPDTVNTMPEATLEAFLDHGKVRPALLEGLSEAEQVLEQVASLGLDMKALGQELLKGGIAAFASDFDGLLTEIEGRLRPLPARR